MTFSTEQETFWAGNFGDDYLDRNSASKWNASNLYLFSKILNGTNGVKTIIEFGANIGLNLIAVKQLLPNIKMTAIEINKRAVKVLKDNISKDLKVFNQSILEYEKKNKFDIVLIKGVLIHMNPDVLANVYKSLYESCNKYMIIAEYYNPSPAVIKYRGHDNKLFKRDFAGEILQLYPDLKLVNYGFAYHLDPNFPQDDLTWFLLAKNE